jgi:hypothetical protein
MRVVPGLAPNSERRTRRSAGVKLAKLRKAMLTWLILMSFTQELILMVADKLIIGAIIAALVY